MDQETQYVTDVRPKYSSTGFAPVGTWSIDITVDSPPDGIVSLASSESEVRVGDTVVLTRDRPERERLHGGTALWSARVVQRADTTTAYLLDSCPDCGAATIAADATNSSSRRCVNDLGCRRQISARLGWLARPEHLNLPSLNVGLIEGLLESGNLSDERYLFDLTDIQLHDAQAYASENLGRWPSRIVDEWVTSLPAELSSARQVPAPRVLAALRPEGTCHRDQLSWNQRWSLLREFGSIAEITTASADDIARALDQPHEGSETPDLVSRRNSIRAQEIQRWFRVPWHRDLLDRWVDHGITLGLDAQPQTLIGVTIALPEGKSSTHRRPPSAARRRVEDQIYGRGGQVSADRRSSPMFTYMVDDASHTAIAPPANARILTATEFEELLERGPEQAPPWPSAAEQMWQTVVRAHPTAVRIGGRGPLPTRGAASAPGALYMFTPETEQIVVVLADNLSAALTSMNTQDDVEPFNRAFTLWVPGTSEELRRLSPILKAPRSAIHVGRPRLVRCDDDWARIPRVAGIYRIHLVDNIGPCVYVGRSQDLRRRPGRHEKTAGLPWSDGSTRGVTKIELMSVKGTEAFHAWTITDLDTAEAEHITRAQQRFEEGSGPRVLNITAGRNGPPSRPKARCYVWKAESSS